LDVSRFAARSFRVGNADGINAKYCKFLHRADGYCYGHPRFPPSLKNRASNAGTAMSAAPR
jgi:hypothetical protein